MGFHTTASGADSLCSSFDPGHRIHVAALRRALALPADWVTVSVEVGVPEQRVVIHAADGEAVTTHTHDAFQMAARMRGLPAAAREAHAPPPRDEASRLRPLHGPVPARWRFVWNESAGILGLPADRLRHAGRGYVSLSANPVQPCALAHEECLGRDFAELAARLS